MLKDLLADLRQERFERAAAVSPADSAASSKDWLKLLQLEMLARGYYMTFRGMFVLSLPHGKAELDGFATAFEGFLDDYAPLLA